MNMGDRIKSLRISHNMTQEELGKKIGVQKSAIRKYEKGEVINIKRATIETLSKIFNVSPSYLMWIEDNNNRNIIKTNRIPVLGKIPAGIPMEMIEDIGEFESISEDMLKGGKEYFALKIDEENGHSMEPEYKPGDVLIVLKQDTCESGDDCIIAVNGDDATFKRVFKNENGIILQPLNPSYPPIIYSNDDIISKPVKILGVVVEFRRTKKR